MDFFTFYLVFQLGLTLASHMKHKGRWFQGESGGGCQIIAFVAKNGKLAPERRGEDSPGATLSEPKKRSGEQLSNTKKERENFK